MEGAAGEWLAWKKKVPWAIERIRVVREGNWRPGHESWCDSSCDSMVKQSEYPVRGRRGISSQMPLTISAIRLTDHRLEVWEESLSGRREVVSMWNKPRWYFKLRY